MIAMSFWKVILQIICTLTTHESLTKEITQRFGWAISRSDVLNEQLNPCLSVFLWLHLRKVGHLSSVSGRSCKIFFCFPTKLLPQGQILDNAQSLHIIEMKWTFYLSVMSFYVWRWHALILTGKTLLYLHKKALLRRNPVGKDNKHHQIL